MKFNRFIVVCIGLMGLFFPLSVNAASDNGFVDEWFKKNNSETEPIDEEGNGEQTETNASNDAATFGEDSSPNLFVIVVQIVLTLAVIIGLIYILLKFLNKRNKLFKHADTLENIGGIPLGTNKSIQMIRIGEHFFVVGVGDNIELLTEIKDEKTIDMLMKDQTNEQPNSNQINELFTQLLPKLTKSKKQTDEKQVKSEFSSLFKSELDSLSDKRKKVTAQYKRKDADKNE